MDREGSLEVVRVLTEQVISALAPEKLADFADAFADFSLGAGALQVAERTDPPRPPASGLDTTLVAGMFFEVLTAASRLPAGPRERVSFVRKKAKDYLVTRLAGQITLSQFYRLLNLIEAKVDYYFEHLTADWVGAPRHRAAPDLPQPVAIDGEALRQALARLSLPLKGKRKITPETLWDFLGHHGGGWFRLLDFEAHFQVNKKTAWTYLNLLLTSGLLEHNGEKANKVRYILAPIFRANPPNSMA
ncbi:MAG: hypothetical protein NTW80_03630 [Deltaproteobacteria bacterium]|nr:hypothetical protein [Deltaproteobacteria bacterium]